MGTILPPSRLLRTMIATTLVVLAIKSVNLVTWAPSSDVLLADTTQALVTAGATASASVLAPAHAEVPQAPQPQLSELSPGRSKQSGPASNDASSIGLEANIRRSQIETRELQLTQRETTLAAADKRLAERVTELLALQSRLQSLQNDMKEHDQANWSGLVKVYEQMRPREAAAVFNALDKPILLEILDRMKPAKVAPVIAAMETEKARQVTADLAAKRTHFVSDSN